MKKKIIELTTRDLYIKNITDLMSEAKMLNNSDKERYQKTLTLLNSVIKADGNHPYFFHYIYCIKNGIEPKEKNEDYDLLLQYGKEIKAFDIKFAFGNIKILKKIESLAQAYDIKIPNNEYMVLNNTIAKKISDELIFDVYLESIIVDLDKLKRLIPTFYKLVQKIHTKKLAA